MSRFSLVRRRQIQYKQGLRLALKLILQILQPSLSCLLSPWKTCVLEVIGKGRKQPVPQSPLRRMSPRAAWPSQDLDRSEKTFIVSTQWDLGVYLLLQYNLSYPNWKMWLAFPVGWGNLLVLPSRVGTQDFLVSFRNKLRWVRTDISSIIWSLWTSLQRNICTFLIFFKSFRSL